jgi:hypothetical protein
VGQARAELPALLTLALTLTLTLTVTLALTLTLALTIALALALALTLTLTLPLPLTRREWSFLLVPPESRLRRGARYITSCSLEGVVSGGGMVSSGNPASHLPLTTDCSLLAPRYLPRYLPLAPT